MFVVYYKNESDTGMEWETPGDPIDCSFETPQGARKAIDELIESDPETWENSEWKIEEEQGENHDRH